MLLISTWQWLEERDIFYFNTFIHHIGKRIGTAHSNKFIWLAYLNSNCVEEKTTNSSNWKRQQDNSIKPEILGTTSLNVDEATKQLTGQICLPLPHVQTRQPQTSLMQKHRWRIGKPPCVIFYFSVTMQNPSCSHSKAIFLLLHFH